MAIGKFVVRFEGASDTGVLSFSVVPRYKYNAQSCVKAMEELIANEKDLFTLTVDPYKTKRSLEQNALLWALLEIMASELSGTRKGGVLAEDCYVDMLELAGAKYEYMMCTKEAFSFLKSQFRATKVMETREGKDGKPMFVVKCFYGSSKMDTKEMTVLIDTVFQRLEEMGISDEYQADVSYRYKEWMAK